MGGRALNYNPSRMSRAPADKLLVVVLWLLAAAAILAHDAPPTADFWEFRAVIREAARDPLHPTHPLLKDVAAHTNRFTPHVLLAGWICRATGLAPQAWLDLQGLAVAALLLTGLGAFARSRWGPDFRPRYLILAALFLWGRGWDWSGELAWHTLCLTWCYPVTLAFALALWGAVLLARWLEAPTAGRGLGAFALLLAAITTHPETGAFASFLGLACCAEPWRPRRAVQVALAIGLAWLLAFAWPLYSLWGMMTHGSGGGWLDREATFFRWHLGNAGAALLGLPVAFRFARDRREPFVVFGVVGLSLAYAAVSLKGGELGRMLFWLVFWLHLAAARQLQIWRILDVGALRERLRTGQVFHVSMGVLLVWGAAGIWHLKQAGAAPIRVASRALTGQPQQRVLEAYAPFLSHLKDGDVVLADPKAGWPLPALTGARGVALLHPHPMQPDRDRRMEDVRHSLDPGTSVEARQEIAGRYGLTHVLLREGIDPQAALFGEEEARSGGLILVRLTKDGARHTPRP